MAVSSSPSPPRLPWLRLWTSAWLFLGALHLTWAIWDSSGDNLPGDLGDGRFNQLVLEHGYQSWVNNAYDWDSPGQFHPVAGTLGWSDTHLGTLPPYALLRWGGLSPERAMQLWFLLVAALNLWSAQGLLVTLGVDRRWAPPLVVAAFAGVPWVWMAGTHAQLLPIFPGLWAASFTWRWVCTGHWHWFVAAAACGLAQFAAGPYLAFFTLLVLGLTTLTAWAIRGARLRQDEATPPLSVAAWAVLGFGALLGLANVWVYQQALLGGAGRPMHEVIDLAPTWRSWFSASPAHRWWPVGWPGGSPEHSEHVLFGGFLPWVLGAVTLGWAWAWRGSLPAARLATALVLTAGAVVLLTVRWPGNFSLWALLCEQVESLRTFRAIGRIHILVHALLVIGFGLMVTQTATGFRRQGIAALALGLLLLETWAGFQPGYPIRDAQLRRQAVLDAWTESGNRPVLAYAPGYTNQPDSHVQLDAWAAALASQRHTLNGYTGGVPPTHLSFLWHPHPEEAKVLARATGVPWQDVSVVEQLPPKIADQLGYAYLPHRSLQRLDGFQLQPASWDLFSPLETHRFAEGVFYQFTPPASVHFRLPDQARRLHFLTGMRPGAYGNGNDSDGYGLTVIVRHADGRVLSEYQKLINPRDVPSDRGFLPLSMELPPGAERRLEFHFTPGPAGHGAWDWPLLGALRWE